MTKPKDYTAAKIGIWGVIIILFALIVLKYADGCMSVKSEPLIPDTVRNFREVKFPVKERIEP